MRNRNSYQFTLSLPPSINHMYLSRRGGGRRLSPEAVVWKQQAHAIACSVFPQLLRGRIAAVYDFYFPTEKADLSNYLKALEDALEGAAYENDKQLYQTLSKKHIDRQKPRVEIKLWVL